MATETLTQFQYQQQIDILEKDLLKLKKGGFVLPKKTISLKGILKGIQITEQDISSAKKSLFKKINL